LINLDDRVGDLFCDVLNKNIYGSRIERFVWRNDRHPTYVQVLNVDCAAIYPATSADTDRLERAFRDLPGTSKQPTTVPSRGAVHDQLPRLSAGGRYASW
jgi:hypothetical protein